MDNLKRGDLVTLPNGQRSRIGRVVSRGTPRAVRRGARIVIELTFVAGCMIAIWLALVTFVVMVQS